MKTAHSHLMTLCETYIYYVQIFLPALGRNLVGSRMQCTCMHVYPLVNCTGYGLCSPF